MNNHGFRDYGVSFSRFIVGMCPKIDFPFCVPCKVKCTTRSRFQSNLSLTNDNFHHCSIYIKKFRTRFTTLVKNRYYETLLNNTKQLNYKIKISFSCLRIFSYNCRERGDPSENKVRYQCPDGSSSVQFNISPNISSLRRYTYLRF